MSGHITDHEKLDRALAASRREVEELQKSLSGLMPYRAHLLGCDEPMTECCTCGLREAADAARAALAAKKVA